MQWGDASTLKGALSERNMMSGISLNQYGSPLRDHIENNV